MLNLLTIFLFAGTLDTVLETLRKIETATESNTDSINVITESIRNVSQKVDKAFGSTTSLSAADLGKKEIEKLKRCNSWIIFKENGKDGILTNEEFDHVQKITDDHELVKYVNDKLRAILKPRAVFSSEDNPWLYTQTHSDTARQKPDAFVCFRGFVETINEGKPFVGVPGNERLLEGVHIIDYNLESGNRAFGELTSHLHNLYANIRQYCDHDDMFRVKGALASKNDIWLVKVEKTTVLEAETISWTAGGGRARLIDFFVEECPVAKAVEQFLRVFGMNLYERGRTSLLGVGACGCVLKVCPSASTPRSKNARAMKVVVGPEKSSMLAAEFTMNQAIMTLPEGNKIVVRASEIKSLLDGAGMIMSEVGSTIANNGLDVRKHALDALRKLHSIGFYHGDARKANLLQAKDGYKWCDVQRAGRIQDLDGTNAMKRLEHDITLLVESFGLASRISTTAPNLLLSYHRTMDQAALDAFVSAICPRFLAADSERAS
jgi:hypothetical protein